MLKRLLFFILSVTVFLVNAQENAPNLITDRPDQTESASVVPLKSLQIETGFIFESDNSLDKKLTTYDFNSTLLRYGLFERLELRLGLAFLKEQSKNNDTGITETVKGLSPLYTGFKILVAEEKGCIPQIAFLGGLILPFSAKEEFKAPYAAPVMRFAFSNTLSDKLSLGYNMGAEWYGENAIPDYYYSITLGIAATDKIGTFIESFGFIPEEGKPSHLVDTGLTFLILPNLQFDLSGGIGLNKNATDAFLGIGVSYRIPQ